MNDETSLNPRTGDALVVIDVQRDFLPGGALAVPEGDEVVGPLNRYARLFAARSLPVFASRDWHPADHCSFVEQGGPWPPHCVAGTTGAQFAPELQLPADVRIISKATQPDREAYSDFSADDFVDRLRRQGVRRLFAGGLATEYCVLATVRDALARGYRVVLLVDAIRAIEGRPGDGRRAIDEMTRLGALAANWEDVAGL
ncbi:MAG: isochorismatase family protein [Pirellulales bacterium]